MMKKARFTRLAVMFCLITTLGELAVRAQEVNGTVSGTVQNESGTKLAGVSVSLNSTASRAFSRDDVTNEDGRFRLVDLPPSVYTLVVRRIGFPIYVEGIRVFVGGNVERNVSLTYEAAPETDTMERRSPDFDLRKPGLSIHYGRNLVDNTPRLRLSYYDFPKTALGISASTPTGKDRGFVSAFGSSVNENSYLIDGANVTAPWSGASGPSPDTDMIQEIEILSLGAPAEYGSVPGAVFNFVTKQGGDDYRFDFSYYKQPASLVKDPTKIDCRCPSGKTGFTRFQHSDLGAHLSGPLLDDQVWFFTGFQIFGYQESQPGTDPRFPAEVESKRMSGKINWQITPQVRLMSSYNDDFWRRPQTPSLSNPFGTLVTLGGHNPSMTFADVTYDYSDDTLLNFRASGSFSPNDFARPNLREEALSHHLDITTGIASGGSRSFGSLKQNRIELKAKMSHYAREFLGREHDFKFGIQLTSASHSGFYGYPGGIRYYDYPGFPVSSNFALLREPASFGGRFRNWGMFVEDVFNFAGRLTVNMGVRFDRATAVSQDIRARDRDGNETSSIIEGLGKLYSWNTLSPRVGLTYKLSSDGKTLFRGSYGRFYRPVITREIEQFHPGNTPTIEARFEPRTGRYSDVVSVFDPTANLQVDPQTRAPRTVQLSFGLERELTAGGTVGLLVVKKLGRNPIGWVNEGGEYGTEVFQLPDGRSVIVHPRLNSGEDTTFILSNPEGWFHDYNAASLSLSKRWSDRWQVQASYTYSESEGIITSNKPVVRDVNGISFADVPQRTDGAIPFGRDPNDLTNAIGKLRDDRTHAIRVHGFAVIPKLDVMIGAQYQNLTGKPWATFTFVPLPQGTREIYIEPPGVRRLPDQSLLDIRFSKTFRPDDIKFLDWIGPQFRQRGKIEILADVFNVLNDQAFEEIVTSNFLSSHFGEGSKFIEPRRVMLGIKVTF